MRYTSDDHRRYAFRDWLRDELTRLEFYQRRGDRYLVSEFARYADQLGARVEEVSLGRYLRDENPVLPTPESCRELARALGRHPIEALLEAGYLTPEDFLYMASPAPTADQLQRQLREIDRYEYLPELIRAQMKASIERQLQQIAVAAPTRPGHEPAHSRARRADAPAEAGQIARRPRAHAADTRDTRDTRDTHKHT